MRLERPLFYEAASILTPWLRRSVFLGQTLCGFLFFGRFTLARGYDYDPKSCFYWGLKSERIITSA